MNQTAVFIGSHNEEIEASIPMLPQLLAKAGWRVVILNPVDGTGLTCVEWKRRNAGA